MIDVNKILFRCSSLGYIMTEPREKAARERGELSETTKTHLIDKYVSEKYGRETDIENKYIKKGLQVEEDSITLYSRLKKEYFKKNTERIENKWIGGEPDLYTGVSIRKAEEVIDTKSSWDIFTFHRAKYKPTEKDYYYQLQGYMDLTGARSARLVYCLNDTPEMLILDELNRLKWKMGVINPEADIDYLEACAKIRHNLTYSDIPMEERMFERIIVRDNVVIEKIHQRVEACREWMRLYLFGGALKHAGELLEKAKVEA